MIHQTRFVVYGFATTHDALVVESVLDSAGVAHRTIPAPRDLGALCGLAIRVAEDRSGDAETAMLAAAVSWTGRMIVEDRVPRRH